MKTDIARLNVVIRTLLFAGTLAVIGDTSLLADSLTPGNTINLSGTTSAANPYLAGTEVGIDISTPFSFTNTSTGGTVSGTLINDVVKETSTGMLDFYYRVVLDSDSSQVGAIRTSGFTGYTTDVNYRTDSVGTVDPASATRFTGADSGSLNFTFSPTAILGGQGSQFCYVKTTATAFTLTGLTDISADSGAGDQGISVQIQTYAPAAAPEPSTWALFSAGVGLLLVRKVRPFRI